jgi:DNA-binding NarL/FixJ family response regulator
MASTRILIVDDHPMVRRGLRETFDGEPDLTVCDEAEDLDAAVEKVRALRPDVVVMDISLPSGSGLELAKRLRSIEPQLRMLFVSMHDDALFAERALQAGALGYINKAQTGKEMVEAVRKVARGEIALSQPTADRLVRRGVSSTPEPLGGVESLSDRELEVFELIGRGTSTRNMAEKLCLSIKTVETHRAHIKQKLNLTNANELVRYASRWLLEQSSAE